VTRYEARTESRNQNLSHGRVVELAGHGEKFLEIGCATGYLGRQLVEHGCEVSGTDLDPDDVAFLLEIR